MKGDVCALLKEEEMVAKEEVDGSFRADAVRLCGGGESYGGRLVVSVGGGGGAWAFVGWGREGAAGGEWGVAIEWCRRWEMVPYPSIYLLISSARASLRDSCSKQRQFRFVI